jgi:hypothetical protein
MEWFIENRRDLTRNVACMRAPGEAERRLLSIASPEQLRRMLTVMLDENEFLSPFGIRSLSKFHQDHPFSIWMGGAEHRVEYWPGVSEGGLFGGNSNWRGPIWFPVNYLLIEALQRYDHYYGPSLQVEFPTGSGHKKTLGQIAVELSRRLTRLFLPDERMEDRRQKTDDRGQGAGDATHPSSVLCPPSSEQPVLFHEYFHAETGEGLGASHQTGWTALIIRCLEDVARNGAAARP